MGSGVGGSGRGGGGASAADNFRRGVEIQGQINRAIQQRDELESSLQAFAFNSAERRRRNAQVQALDAQITTLRNTRDQLRQQ